MVSFLFQNDDSLHDVPNLDLRQMEQLMEEDAPGGDPMLYSPLSPQIPLADSDLEDLDASDSLSDLGLDTS